MTAHLSAALVHDIVDEHAHICTDCPPSARRSVVDQSGLRSLIRQLTGMHGPITTGDRVTAVVDELQRHKHYGCGECSCGAVLLQPYTTSWETHRAEAILDVVDTLNSRP